MDAPNPNPKGADSAVPAEGRAEEIRAQLRKLERRDWWLWSLAIVVMLLLTFAVVSMSFPGLMRVDDPFFQFSLDGSVRGLVGLVLIFNAYSVYQQVMIKRLRRQFSEQLDAMGHLRVHAEELRLLATTDPLTGLANRRTGEERLTVEVERSRRYGHPLTLVAMDLDNFKQINDKYGHAAGDLVLREFAHKLAGTVRFCDLAIRVGGDEFLAMLPECRVDQASILLSRFGSIEVNYHGTRIPVGFSVGAVGYEPGETLDQFINRADQCLYAHKRASNPTASQRDPKTLTSTLA